jgi:hypothetical protein
MTTIDPAANRPDPAARSADAWAAVTARAQNISNNVTARAIELAQEGAGHDRPGPITRWRRRHAAARANTADRTHPLAVVPTPAGRVATSVRPSAGRLRWIPPIAALGTAWVLQVIAMTDTVGGALATAAATSPVPAVAARPQYGYLAALLLGIAVASCAEGGAAYLMDLYDKHLLARDSTGVLRLAMVAYVAVSAGVLHWWLGTRHLPSIVAWVLAGMSASALFLWSRGSRWRNREAMRAANQLDPAMPKLPGAAKVFHPWRWLVTLYLVSWEPVATPEEARIRYDRWSAARTEARKACEADARARQLSAEENGDSPPAAGHNPAALADALWLAVTYGTDVPGRNELYRRHRGNKEKWSAALRALADVANSSPATPDEEAA